MTEIYKSEKDTPSWKIFHVQYRISIPQAFTLPLAHRERYGTYSTGNPDVDEQLANEQTIVLRTIAQMAELHDEGVPINLLKPEKFADDIYHTIYDHIEDYEPLFGLKTRVSITDEQRAAFTAAADDLVKLQEFADFVKEVDRRNIPKSMQPNSAEAILQSFMIMGKPHKAGSYVERRPTMDVKDILHRKPKGGGQWG